MIIKKFPCWSSSQSQKCEMTVVASSNFFGIVSTESILLEISFHRLSEDVPRLWSLERLFLGFLSCNFLSLTSTATSTTKGATPQELLLDYEMHTYSNSLSEICVGHTGRHLQDTNPNTFTRLSETTNRDYSLEKKKPNQNSEQAHETTPNTTIDRVLSS